MIPYTFREENSEYIIVPALRQFCMEQGIKNAGFLKNELFDLMEKFAEQNSENREKVANWLDHILKVGIKMCIVGKIHFCNYNDLEFISEKIKEKLKYHTNLHICNYKFTNKVDLIQYCIEEDLSKISFVFGIKLLKSETIYGEGIKTVIYPMFVDIDLKCGFCICTSKSISNLFLDNEEENKRISDENKIQPIKLLMECQEKVRDILGYELEKNYISKEGFKKSLFNILDYFTETPKEIKKKIEEAEEINKEYVNYLFKMIGFDISPEDYQDALNDLEIIVEKYASILHPDESIFTKGRKAYLVKFTAKDNEFTKIEETANGLEPLQRKKAFFDSKKAIYVDKKCERIGLCHHRINTKYYGNKDFPVTLEILTNGWCKVNFPKFVEKEEIQDVLSRVIQLYNIQNES